MRLARLWSVAAIVCAAGAIAPRSHAQTWTQLTNPPPTDIALMMLLPNGTVIAADGPSGGYGRDWYKLTPDATGSYQNGTWVTIASMTDTRLWYASQILRDGRFFVAGGEYGTNGSGVEVYNPQTNTWSTIAVPAGILVDGVFGDGTDKGFRDPMADLLPDGRVLISPVVTVNANVTVIFDPVTNTISQGPSSLGDQNEATWVKLPDDSLLTIDKETVHSERFIPAMNAWVADSDVPVSLYDPFGDELGAGFLLADGRAFFLGSSGHTAFYTPSGSASPGVWTAGPDIPDNQGTPDAGAAMMVDGTILCATSPTPTSGDHFPTPTSYYIFDPVANAFTRINGPLGMTTNQECYKSIFLALPNGQIMYSHFGADVWVFTPAGAPLAAGRPRICNITDNGDGSFHLTGIGINGISQGAAYGDDAQMNTNYPLVRLTGGGGNVYYARTFNWSDTSVQTGNRVLSTEFVLPAGLPPGNYDLAVATGGFVSDPYRCPKDIMVENDSAQCGATVAWSAGAPGTGVTYRINGGVVTSPHFFPIGTTTVDSEFTLGGTCSFTVTVLDTQDPTIDCPPDRVEVNTPGLCGASVTLVDPTTGDNCPGVTSECRVNGQLISSPHFFPVGSTTVACTAIDASGNSSPTCTYQVQVNDVEPPDVTCHTATVALDLFGNALLSPSTFGAAATDNCQSPGCPVTLSLSQSVFLCPPVNVPIAVTVYGTDCHLNIGECHTTVTFPDPDCNQNGMADICDILSGLSKDCNNNRIPDECECIWNNGEVEAGAIAANGQGSHEGGGIPDGVRGADNFYLNPGAIHRLFAFTGWMFTDSAPQLRSARLDIYEDCNGLPSGTPIFSFTNSVVASVTPIPGSSFFLVKYVFDLCSRNVYLDGGKTYWVSLVGISDHSGGTGDSSFWASAEGPIMGVQPVKSIGGPHAHGMPFVYGPWMSAAGCCGGCVNLAFTLVGETCPIIWNNRVADLSPGGKGGSLSGATGTGAARTADNLVIKPCEDQAICYAEAYIWTNCNPPQGFIELYASDCDTPSGSALFSAAPTRAIPTGQTLTINSVNYAGYLLQFGGLNWPLEAGTPYWVSAGATGGGFQTRAFFAYNDYDCTGNCDIRISPGRSRVLAPVPSSVWARTTRDYAFRIAAFGPPNTQNTASPGPGSTPAPCPADFDQSGSPTIGDIFSFLAAWFAGC